MFPSALVVTACLTVAAGAAPAQGGEPATVEVAVDCAAVIGPRACPERYLNNSILHAPPLALADRLAKEYGRPKIMRCWLTLNNISKRSSELSGTKCLIYGFFWSWQ